MPELVQKPLITQWRIKPAKPKHPKVKSRTWVPKVRTGCRVCKQRKLKCGEEKPRCLRCVKAGFECDYATPKAWVFEPPSDRTSQYPSTKASETSPTRPSLWGDRLDLDEQRALVYFKERTAPILSTFAHVSAHFWTRIIPQVSVNYATVRSAMIAVSSLHENVHYRGRSLQPAALPEKLYATHLSKSIATLTRRDQPPSREVVLMTCLLFLACENLKQSSTNARLHVQSGLKVLREWKNERKKATSTSYAADSLQDVIENTVEPIFARLEAQASLGKSATESHAAFRKYDLNWERLIVPEAFADLFAARDAMHDGVQWAFYRSRLCGGPLLVNNPAYRDVTRLMDQWNRTFQDSFPQYGDRSWPGWSAATALRVHQLALRLSLHAEALDSNTLWDEQLDDVKWLLDACNEIIISGPPPTTQRDSLWLYDFCLTPPLLLTSLHCRHPVLRRKAIALMRIQHCWGNED